MFIGLVSMNNLDGMEQTKASGATSNRYLYTLNCQAILEKFDTISRTSISTVDLTKRSTIGSAHNDEVNSVEGCLNYGAAYQAETSVFYTVAPTKGSIGRNARGFYIFAFHIPDLQAPAPIGLPGKYDLWDFPMLMTERLGQIGLIAHNRYDHVSHGDLVSASRPIDLPGSRLPTANDVFYELDLSAYHFTDAELAGPTNKLAYQPLERSGDTELIKVPSPKQGWAWIIVDVSGHRLIRLNLPFHGMDRSVHLSPGGHVVLAQEASYSPAGAPMTKGRLALIDAGTGDVIKTWTDPALDRKYILTVTPKGQMVYYGGGSTIFVPLDGSYSGEPVIDIRQRALGPYFFYADR
jgi:hypothetical protein